MVPTFRTVWIAVLITNIGGWIASVATAWLMTSLDPSPLMVSMVSAATNLPLFFFALPAGALADIVDRRQLLILAQVFMLVLTLILLALTMSGLILPASLLALIFLIEAGTAFETPAYLAVLPRLPGTNCNKRWLSMGPASTSRASWGRRWAARPSACLA